MECLHEVAEAYLVEMMGNAPLCAIHAKRVTLQLKDVHLVRRIRGDVDEFGAWKLNKKGLVKYIVVTVEIIFQYNLS